MEIDDVAARPATEAAPTETSSPSTGAASSGPSTGPDLDAIEADLADVEIALARLDAGTYRTDEVTGAELPDELLAARPTARRRSSV